MKKELSVLTDAMLDLNGFNNIQYQYFNELLNHRTIILNDEINNDLFENVIIPLLRFETEGNEPVNLYINTIGGNVLNGMKLLDIIDKYSIPLNIYCFDAFSMGAIIMCAGKDNPNVKKYCYNFSYILFHDGYNAVEGETGTVADVLKFNEAVDKKLRDYVISHTLISEEKYDSFARRQIFMDAQEMLEYGIVNEIL